MVVLAAAARAGRRPAQQLPATRAAVMVRQPSSWAERAAAGFAVAAAPRRAAQPARREQPARLEARGRPVALAAELAVARLPERAAKPQPEHAAVYRACCPCNAHRGRSGHNAHRDRNRHSGRAGRASRKRRRSITRRRRSICNAAMFRCERGARQLQTNRIRRHSKSSQAAAKPRQRIIASSEISVGHCFET